MTLCHDKIGQKQVNVRARKAPMTDYMPVFSWVCQSVSVSGHFQLRVISKSEFAPGVSSLYIYILLLLLFIMTTMTLRQRT